MVISANIVKFTGFILRISPLSRPHGQLSIISGFYRSRDSRCFIIRSLEKSNTHQHCQGSGKLSFSITGPKVHKECWGIGRQLVILPNPDR